MFELKASAKLLIFSDRAAGERRMRNGRITQ